MNCEKLKVHGLGASKNYEKQLSLLPFLVSLTTVAIFQPNASFNWNYKTS